MRIIPSREAVRLLTSNKQNSTWSDGNRVQAAEGGPYELFDEGMGAARVYKADPAPVIRPKFRISRSASIFTSGSCFAREIERQLVEAGANILSWTPNSPVQPVAFNRYTSHAIIGDFRFALQTQYDPENIIKTGEKWMDFTGNSSADTREELLSQRVAVIEAHKRSVEADAIFLTLGLVETWFDTQTKAYTNIAPWGQFLGNRFELHITDYAANREAIRAFITFMREIGRKDMRFVLTVSPVPLSSTFSGQDIVVANAYSKSVLRAVAQDIADGDDLVDYFPSYEMVTLADPNEAWRADYRHVRPAFVRKIISRFSEAYFE